MMTITATAQSRPPFSWDKVPVCIHFGNKSRTLTDKELHFVARTSNLVCFEKAHGMDELGSTEKGIAHDAKRLKALNKNVRVLYYWNGILNFPLSDAFKETRTKPNYVLRDSKGVPLRKSGKTGVEQYNIFDEGCRKWWASKAGKAVKEWNCDGIFMDAVPQIMSRVPRQAGKSRAAAAAAAKDMMARAKAAMGSNGILIYNGLRSKKDGKVSGQEFLGDTDGAMVEHFGAFSSSSKEAIFADITAISKAGKQGKIVVVKGWPGFNWQDQEKMKQPKETLAAESKKNITFPLACFLIAAQEHGYFCYSWGYREMHGVYVEYPEFSKSLGKPKGDFTKKGWQFTRSFEHADVWVDLAKKDAKIEWK